MVSFVNSQTDYNVDGDYFDIGSSSLPIKTWNTNIYYTVNVGSSGTDIRTTVGAGAFQGNRYIFTFDADVGTKFTFYASNSSAIARKTTQTYDSASDTTHIEVWIGATNNAAIEYRIPGNPLNITPNQTITGSIAPWGSWSFSGTVCYLLGTKIRTPSGEVAIEDLKIGDLISVWDPISLTEICKKVKWLGKSVACCTDGIPGDSSNHPIKIEKDAISDNIPHSDLFITSEHCIFINKSFVPARMLVNGCTISYESNISSYTYYHIETEDHSVIWANGLKAESYLSTGNSQQFANRSSTPQPPQLRKNWEHDSAAPLRTERHFVEPLFYELLERAKMLHADFRPVVGQQASDSELTLRTEAGAVIRPLRQSGEWVTFMLPESVHHVLLHSRVVRPSDSIGPFVDDRRQLGVLVGDIKLFSCDSTRSLNDHLVSRNTKGWREYEQGMELRWTSGDAYIDLCSDPCVLEGQSLLSIQIMSSGSSC
ncbi:Hint domain-containing protein [Asaia prunellae]|uniref:Hint domain-containing protein n=1 Tax=Asaia prunellae TaxID=610245 RepID=UPI000A00E5A8|nr:Hint domain-containing protein [Asaia prunellae]